MQKRDLSVQKLPRLGGGDGNLSSKLFNMTGLRVFPAKFMQDLKAGRPASKHQENKIPITPLKKTPNQLFTGQDTTNQLPSTPLRLDRPIPIELKKVVKVKPKCIRPRGLKNMGNTCYMYPTHHSGTPSFRLFSVWKSSIWP